MSARCAYYYNEALAQRESGMLCPEKPARYLNIRPEVIRAELPGVAFRSFEARSRDILTAVHDPSYVEFVETAYEKQKRHLDAGREVFATEDTYSQALLAASGACQAIDHLQERTCDRAFVAVRPPGHHANAVRSMGFCIFNNAAIAARYAQDRHGLRRILIIDWDIHPGNGTQEIFWEDPTVFTLSLHQDDLMPAAGQAHLTGAGAGEGYSRNVPLPKGMGGEEVGRRLAEALDAILDTFTPGFIIISAGFDMHHRDPASSMNVNEDDFAAWTRIVCDRADLNVLSVLEGGYDAASLRSCVVSHCRALKGS